MSGAIRARDVRVSDVMLFSRGWREVLDMWRTGPYVVVVGDDCTALLKPGQTVLVDMPGQRGVLEVVT